MIWQPHHWLREHAIFRKLPDEDLKDIFGLAITIVTTAKTKKEADAFFRHIGIPSASRKFCDTKHRELTHRGVLFQSRRFIYDS